MSSSALDNDDLLLEILLRLPVRTLMKLKSVNRTWKTLISSDSFRCLHMLRHPNRPPSFLLQTSGTSVFSYFDPLSKSKAQNPKPYTFSIPNPNILSSCNGLMLLLSTHDGRIRYYVYNPATKESREIFRPDPRQGERKRGMALAFDPSKSIHYKIVAVTVRRSKNHWYQQEFRVDIYDSEKSAWERRPEEFTSPSYKDFTDGFYCNGAIHWGNLYYDIGRKVVGYLPLLKVVKDELRNHSCGGSYSFRPLRDPNDGRLNQVVQVWRKGSGKKFAAIYEMAEDYSGWSFKRLCRIRPKFYKFGALVDLVGAGDDGEGEEERVLVHNAAEKINWSSSSYIVYEFGESLTAV